MDGKFYIIKLYKKHNLDKKTNLKIMKKNQKYNKNNKLI